MDPIIPPQDTQVMPQDGQPPQTPNTSPMDPRPKRNWKKPLAWVGGIIVVAGLAAGAWWWFNRPEPAPAEVKNDIPLINYQLESGPLNVFYPNSELSISELHVNEQIFEGLVRFDGGTQIAPLLAESWTNPDESTWVFKLKPNVKFHNGSTLTAEDVKYSLEQLKSTPFGEIFNSTIQTVEVVSDTEVRIVTSGPDPILLNKLAFLFIVDNEVDAEDPVASGSGPYIVKPNSTPSEKSLSLVAFDDYHGGHIYTRELGLSVVESEDDRLEALQNGQTDLAPFTTTTKISNLQNLGYSSLEVGDVSVWTLLINHNKTSPLQDLGVRQAIYHAIDIDALIAASGTDGEPVSQFLLPDIAGYDPSIERLPYNPDLAKSLLNTSGHGSGLTLTLDYFAAREAVAKVIAEQLQAVGITVTLNGHQNSSDLIDRLLSGEAELIYIAPGTDVLDGSDVSSQVLQNPNYTNEGINILLDEVSSTFDSAKRLELLKEISRKAAEDVAVVPLFHSTTTYMYNKPYNIELDVLGYLGVYFWEVYATE